MYSKLKKYYGVAVIGLLMLVLVLGACSDAGPVLTSAATREPTATANGAALNELVSALNSSNLEDALAFFSEDGKVEVANPPYLSYTDQGNVRQLSYGESVTYQGYDWIKAYLVSLINDKFQSQPGHLTEANNQIKWVAVVSFNGANFEMSFEATLSEHEDKISQLIATYNDLDNLK